MLAGGERGDAGSAHLFSKKPLLKISKLRLGQYQNGHLQANKLSNKMGRRDIQFYDLYKLKKPEESVTSLQDKGYLLDGVLTGSYRDARTGLEVTINDEDEPIYGDIEVDDFNKLFRNQHLIDEKFGKTISVRLQKTADGELTRHVAEDLSRLDMAERVTSLEVEDPNEMSCIYSQAGGSLSQAPELNAEEMQFTRSSLDNTQIKVLHEQMKNFRKEFKKSNAELSALFIKCSGDTGKMRLILDNKKGVTVWNALEDLALMEPDTSVEFQVLLEEKGWVEIVNRRNFLAVKPVFEEEPILEAANV